MKLSELSPVPGAVKERFRVGRGHGSGNGKTSGRGHKGQKARSGYSRKRGFEGGQMPLARRLPKRGFVNIFAKPPAIVNLSAFEVFDDDAVVSEVELLARGIVRKCENGVKVLGQGDLTKRLTIRARAFSASAVARIEALGGKAEVV
ncbi:MAG: 50S ribosomal protein L15 [Oscillospiraceae bacterium]|jgi:large subunit ribosomal protein L15|nr:50S ribosomal protein L15 [Oscillospiraceae bacterium]